MKTRPIYLLPLAVFFVAGSLVASFPGERVGLHLIGAALCLIPISINVGWSKWVAVLLCLGFLAQAGYDSDQGMKRLKKTTVEMQASLNKQRSESGK